MTKLFTTAVALVTGLVGAHAYSSSEESIEPTIIPNPSPSIGNFDELESKVEYFTTILLDLASKVSTQASRIENLEKQLERAEKRWYDTFLSLKTKQDGILWSCLIAGGGILTLFLIYKFVIKKKVLPPISSNVVSFEQSTENRISEFSKRKLNFYMVEGHFIEMISQRITGCLEHFSNNKVEFERVFDQSIAHFSIINFDDKQRSNSNVPDSNLIYLSIGKNTNTGGMEASNEIRLNRDNDGNILVDNTLVGKLLRKVHQ